MAEVLLLVEIAALPSRASPSRACGSRLASTTRARRVQFPMLPAAEGDREFVARFAAQRAWLHIAQMMGIGWLAAADEARLLHDIAKVLAAAIAPRGRNREHALFDALGPTPVGAFAGGNHLRPGNQRQRPFDRGCSRIG